MVLAGHFETALRIYESIGIFNDKENPSRHNARVAREISIDIVDRLAKATKLTPAAVASEGAKVAHYLESIRKKCSGNVMWEFYTYLEPLTGEDGILVTASRLVQNF